MAHVDLPRLKEHSIPVLSLEEMRRLLAAAEEYDGGACLAAVGLMLYAGIRPEEVRRLDWAQINLREGMVSLRARHSRFWEICWKERLLWDLCREAYARATGRRSGGS